MLRIEAIFKVNNIFDLIDVIIRNIIKIGSN